MSNEYVRYDYAWKTPGWSVQNPTFNQVPDGYTDPGLPDDVDKVHLYGEFMDWETGRPLEGYLEIRCFDELTYVTTNTRVMPGVKKIRFNRGGFDIVLPATDSDNLVPEFTYRARLTVAGKTNAFQFELLTLDDPVNINDLLPAPTGSIIIDESSDDGGVELGARPRKLTVNLTTGADFKTSLVSEEGWLVGDVVTLRIGNLSPWTAVITDKTALFTVDKAVADAVVDGTHASLVVTNGSDDEVWAVGRVLRHDGVS